MKIVNFRRGKAVANVSVTMETRVHFKNGASSRKAIRVEKISKY